MEASAEQQGVGYQIPRKFDPHRIVCIVFTSTLQITKITNASESLEN
jgi:hypothetical protein